MRMLHKAVLVLVTIVIESTFACEDTSVPWHYLGKSLSELETYFVSITYDGNFEDEYFNQKHDARWLAIDRKRHYITLHTVDRTVTELYITDTTYVTEQGIRVGDSFGEIRRAYGDSLDFDAEDIISGRSFIVRTTDGRVSFSLSGHMMRERIRKGETFAVEDQLVQNLKLWKMHLKLLD